MSKSPERQVVWQIWFWSQIALFSSMLVSGAIYAIAPFLDLTQVSLLVYPFALQLARGLQILFYGFIGLVIVFGYYRRLTRRKKLIDQNLKDRLRILVSQIEQRMMIRKPVRPFILPRSSNAANAGRSRIIVGEKLVQSMDDQELTGIIGHELAHGIQHHVLIKAILFPLLLVMGISLYIVTKSFPGGTVLVWTIFAGIVLAEMPLSWKLEYSADHRSAEVFGKNSMIRALAYLRATHYDGPSFTHPPLSNRINRLTNDRKLKETVGEGPVSPVLPSASVGGDRPKNEVSIHKSDPVEFPKYVYAAAAPRLCNICGSPVPAGKSKCGACGTTLKS
jgi:Zn-dependent protease with chaperone function